MIQDYVAQAWTFCDRLHRDSLDFRRDDHVEILKWYKPSSTTEDYCSELALTDNFEGCVTVETDPNYQPAPEDRPGGFQWGQVCQKCQILADFKFLSCSLFSVTFCITSYKYQ